MSTILTDNSYGVFCSPKAPSTYRMGQQLVLPFHNVYIFEGACNILLLPQGSYEASMSQSQRCNRRVAVLTAGAHVKAVYIPQIMLLRCIYRTSIQ